ncbi:MAG TPA: outer membrane lipoprotein-sorting protein [Candidatus Binataceae bacterium]|nr:outer membrane lipoprotein-sorting protein [Candidatus Binataceae bacterium]
MRRAILTLITILLFVGSTIAAQPDVATIVKNMKQGLQGPDNAVRLLTMKVNSSNGATTVEWHMAQANGTANGAHWMLTVVIAPQGAKGMAFLDRQKAHQTSTLKYIYLPATKRVMQYNPVQGYDSFFATDFTYQDLGFVALGGGGEKLVGTETRAGKQVYKLEDHPINSPYYSKVISYVLTDSMLPVERDFYDRAGRLFKTERCTVETVDGVPTITKMVMDNANSGGSSEIDVTKVFRDKQPPAELFDPAHLPKASDHPFWKSVTQP